MMRLVCCGLTRSGMLCCVLCTSTEDVQLIESLEESKRVATEINEKVTEARETETAINDSRNKYRPVAKRGAMLFFLLNSLNKIHAFYQYSLNAFVVVFSRGLERAPGGRKKKDKTTLAELARRITGEAAPFEQVMEMARRSSHASAAGSKAGSKRGSRATDTGPAKGESGVAEVLLLWAALPMQPKAV
jgi:dynein heavy chain